MTNIRVGDASTESASNQHEQLNNEGEAHPVESATGHPRPVDISMLSGKVLMDVIPQTIVPKTRQCHSMRGMSEARWM